MAGGARWAWWGPVGGVLLSAGCANPISNQLFYDDALMVAALPSEERVGPPSEVRLARVGDSELLALAVAEAAVLDDLTEVVARSGDLLRSAQPSERTDVGRTWEAAQVAGDLAGERVSWWIRGEVLRPDEQADITWSMEIAPAADGPWVEVGVGAHEPDGDGGFTWEIGPSLEAMGRDPAEAPGQVTATYTLEDDGETRNLELAYDDGEVAFGPWVMVGDIALGWQGQLALTDADGQLVEAFGAASVITTPDGGWGMGELYPAGETWSFTTCWDSNGDRQYEEGDLDPVADPGACTVDDPF